MFVVVTTFYTLESMKSILLPKFVFFSFKATPFTSKIQIYYSVVYSIIFMGVALHIITCPPPFTQGRLKDSCHICGGGATSASGGSFDEPIGSACEMPQGSLCKPPARLVVMTAKYEHFLFYAYTSTLFARK